MDDSRHIDVIHFVPNALAAARFVEPLALALQQVGIRVEIWSEKGAYEFLADRLRSRPRWQIFSLGQNPAKLIIGFIRIWRDINKISPTAIEAHFSRGALVPLLAAKLAGLRIRIYHNHGIAYLGYDGMLRFILKWLERINISLATHVVTVAPGMRQTYLDDGLLLPEKCTVMGPGSACGLDLSKYIFEDITKGKVSAKEKLGLRSSFVVMYVGRPHKRKGFHLTLRAWAKYFRHETNMRLLLAGVNYTAVEQVLGRAVPSNVYAMGFIDDLRPHYAASDIVVLPSEHEGFGYSLLEGAASGCCLIASDIRGPDTILKHEVNGFAIPVNDDEALTSRIIELRDNRVLRLKMSNAALESAIKFDRENILSKYRGYMCAMLDYFAY